MAEKARNLNVNPAARPQHAAENDTAGEQDVDRLEVTTGGADQPSIVQGDLARQTAAYDASNEEEIDALRVDLTQDARGRDTRDGTGKIVDELAAEHIAGMTEVGRELDDKGVESVVPGRNNPSGILRRHHPKEVARAQDVVEGNLEEPRDEGRIERKVDEGTAA